MWACMAQVAFLGSDSGSHFLNGAGLGWGRKSRLGLLATTGEREIHGETSVLRESDPWAFRL